VIERLGGHLVASQGHAGQESLGRKFHVTITKNIFTVKVVKLWTRFPREVVECLSLEILKTEMDTFLSNLL